MKRPGGEPTLPEEELNDMRPMDSIVWDKLKGIVTRELPPYWHFALIVLTPPKEADKLKPGDELPEDRYVPFSAHTLTNLEGQGLRDFLAEWVRKLDVMAARVKRSHG